MAHPLYFRQLQYGRCDLLIVTNDVGNGVLIPKTRFLGAKLVPILINKNNISELPTSWTGLRKALFVDSKISDFKRWLTDELSGVETDEEGNPVTDENGRRVLKNPGADYGSLEFDEISTIKVKKDIPFDPMTFTKYFFSDESHNSSAQYRGERHTADKIFPTARGSAWLFQQLRNNNYGVEVSSFSFS